MKPYLDDGDVRLYAGDCLDVMREMDAESVDAVVTDPPYGLEFMGKEWDAIGRLVGPGGRRRERERVIEDREAGKWQPGSSYGAHAKNPRCEKCGRLRFDHEGRKCACAVPAFNARASEYGIPMQEWHLAWCREAHRVLKPGGHLLAFGGTRTFHRLTCAIEDAGFEVRDCLSWLYGSGFPKSLNVEAAIDRHTASPERRAWLDAADPVGPEPPADPRAAQWRGFGSAAKPAWEPIVVARKPLAGTVAFNVMTTGGFWVDVPDGESGEGSRREKVCHDCREALPSVRDHDASLGISAASGQEAADAWTGVQSRDDEGRAQPALERGALAGRPGLRDRERAGAGPDQGASPGGRAVHGAAPESGRDGPSPERDQDGQPPVESRGEGREIRAREASRPDRCARCGRTLYGTGALNIDGCRIHTPGSEGKPYTVKRLKPGATLNATGGSWRPTDGEALPWEPGREYEGHTTDGRWPANVVLDEEAAALLDEQAPNTGGGGFPSSGGSIGRGDVYGAPGEWARGTGRIDANAGASRFFYTAKASSAERDGTTHPTVKPLALMRWLVRLVTPPGGLVLDPFAGSGTTLLAAREEGLRAVGIEREEEYLAMAAHRLRQLSLLGGGA